MARCHERTRGVSHRDRRGGTGGHFFPAEALAGELIERGRWVVLMTDARAVVPRGTVFDGRNQYVSAGAGIAGRGGCAAARRCFRWPPASRGRGIMARIVPPRWWRSAAIHRCRRCWRHDCCAAAAGDPARAKRRAWPCQPVSRAPRAILALSFAATEPRAGKVAPGGDRQSGPSGDRRADRRWL